MKRHESLHPLSEHHHHALVRALVIRRAAEAPGAERSTALRQAAEQFLQHWKASGRQHFQEEEEILLPAFSWHVDLSAEPIVIKMLSQHAQIRARIDRLESLLASDQPVDAEVKELGATLHDHVRLEEDELFPRIEQVLSEEELAALGPRFTWLHRECDTP